MLIKAKLFARKLCLRCAHVLRRHARNLAATLAFLAVFVGLWWERPSLALVVCGTIVFAALAASHLLTPKKGS